MRVVIMIVLLAVAWPAQARCDLSSARLGNEVLKVGDSERKVMEHEPDRSVRLENRYGGAAGIRYEFYLREKTVQIYVRGGRVFRVCHVLD
jgi:hypothetical protein